MIALLNFVLDKLMLLLVVGFELVLFEVDGLDLGLEAFVHCLERVVFALKQ